MSNYIFFDLRPSILLGSVKSWVFFFFKSIQSYEYFIWSSLKVCLITMAILALNLPRGADSLVRIFLLSTLQWIKKIFYRHQKVLVTPCTIKQYYWSSVWTDIYIYIDCIQNLSSTVEHLLKSSHEPKSKNCHDF